MKCAFRSGNLLLVDLQIKKCSKKNKKKKNARKNKTEKTTFF